MKRNRFSEEQIVGILKEHEAGVSVADLCRRHGVSDASVYKWKANSRVDKTWGQRRCLLASHVGIAKPPVLQGYAQSEWPRTATVGRLTGRVASTRS